jgi:hypothetical protein
MERINETVENRPYPCSYCGAINMGRESDTTDRSANEIITECVWSCSRCGRVYKRGVVNIKKLES